MPIDWNLWQLRPLQGQPPEHRILRIRVTVRPLELSCTKFGLGRSKAESGQRFASTLATHPGPRLDPCRPISTNWRKHSVILKLQRPATARFNDEPSTCRWSYTALMRIRPAKAVARPCVDAGFWIDHAEISEHDFEWLEQTEELTLWNVKVPDGFLARLPRLWWLDLRGGTRDDLSICSGCSTLEYLSVSHVRGLSDISIIADLERLRYLQLYAQSKLTVFPSCKMLRHLERAVLGQLKGLKELGGLLDAPNLRELALIKRVGVSKSDIMAIKAHPAMQSFWWDTADVPISVRQPVVDAIGLPELYLGWPLDWFAERGRGPGKGHGSG